MNIKKGFKVYYLLLSEGTTEFNLFAYITKNKFRTLFAESKIQFSSKVEIPGFSISQGKLGGISNVKSFKPKYNKIKGKYKGQKLFFLLDKDLDDSSAIETSIKKDGHSIQFIKYNSEYLLLKFANKKLKEPSDFSNLGDFRKYCKSEFQKYFKKKAPDFKDQDFDSVFKNSKNEKIKAAFDELFSIIKTNHHQ
jgi:hypothetical protein